MVNKILLVFIGFDVAFFLCATLLLVLPLYTRSSFANNNTVDNIANHLLLDNTPLTATIVNAIFMYITFAVSLPALFIKTNRTYLVAHCWGIVFSATFTLVIGLTIWFSTLETHKNLKPMWEAQSAETISMLQARFKCCGYDNPALFVRDDTCTTAATAARLGGCMIPFASFANRFLDIVFTSFFGFVAVDFLTLLAACCLIKDRKERQRYRLIDEKRGFGGI
ncbi:hypothetical protein PV10_05984 [Exophiala mesophila]|uniref:Tetraspanin n=1 Tax=Exophiala mesophila TaxID=212818 RepID=A0A0D1WQT2_EXOME|nr:uncharacterized protein PV10_05984 [Exophiala mesophila]KIV91445.1 hypothetical protein PV10_05984 [Exophiala mesophila]